MGLIPKVLAPANAMKGNEIDVVISSLEVESGDLRLGASVMVQAEEQYIDQYAQDMVNSAPCIGPASLQWTHEQ